MIVLFRSSPRWLKGLRAQADPARATRSLEALNCDLKPPFAAGAPDPDPLVDQVIENRHRSRCRPGHFFKTPRLDGNNLAVLGMASPKAPGPLTEAAWKRIALFDPRKPAVVANLAADPLENVGGQLMGGGDRPAGEAVHPHHDGLRLILGHGRSSEPGGKGQACGRDRKLQREPALPGVRICSRGGDEVREDRLHLLSQAHAE